MNFLDKLALDFKLRCVDRNLNFWKSHTKPFCYLPAIIGLMFYCIPETVGIALVAKYIKDLGFLDFMRVFIPFTLSSASSGFAVGIIIFIAVPTVLNFRIIEKCRVKE